MRPESQSEPQELAIAGVRRNAPEARGRALDDDHLYQAPRELTEGCISFVIKDRITLLFPLRLSGNLRLFFGPSAAHCRA